MIRFSWDDEKNEANLKKHGIGFELASVNFDDPFALLDEYQQHEEELRAVTLGIIGDVVFTVTHLPFEESEDDPSVLLGRLITARRATRREAKRYDKNRAKEEWNSSER